LNTSKNTSITTRDIVTIAILGSLGGALSTFVGYLGNLVNLSLGIPFGAGQFMAGLHVFWIVLMRVLVPKTGIGTAGGLLKGLVEMFTGSTHGIVVVIVSLIQGVVIDVGAAVGGDVKDAGTPSRILWWVSAGIASGSNVLVFQLFYFTGAPLLYISVITILAFCSGVIFAGYFAWETFDFLRDTGLVPSQVAGTDSPILSKRDTIYRNIPAIIFLTLLTIGSLYYTATIARTFSDPYSCDVQGLVDNPYVYYQTDFAGQEVTIEAELIGAYIHFPPANYTGILVSTILENANPASEATNLIVRARDGYSITFGLDDVMNDDRMLLTESDDGLWLIAGDYDGSMWVRQVSILEVY
jgi:energy-coupling factor transport system substrate-specific component